MFEMGISIVAFYAKGYPTYAVSGDGDRTYGIIQAHGHILR